MHVVVLDSVTDGKLVEAANAKGVKLHLFADLEKRGAEIERRPPLTVC